VGADAVPLQIRASPDRALARVTMVYRQRDNCEKHDSFLCRLSHSHRRTRALTEFKLSNVVRKILLGPRRS